MKLSNPVLRGIILLIMACLYITGSGQEIIRIKFSPTTANTLRAYDNKSVKVSANGTVITGISSVDNVIAKYRGTEMKRVFRPAGKFEARHKQFGLDLWYELKIEKKDISNYNSCIKELKSLAEIKACEPKLDKQLYGIETDDNPVLNWTPNDPRYNEQWHYWNTGQTGGTPGADIRLQDAWEIQRGSSNVIVAIIDQGVDYNHVDLGGAMWVNDLEATGTTGVDDDNNGYIDDIHGYGFGDGVGNYTPGSHGTHVAGTVGAISNNGIGVSGVAGGSGSADGVRLMSCAVFGNIGTGGFDEAFIYAADNGASIAQNSWGYTNPGGYEQSVLDAIDYFIAFAGKDLGGAQNGPLFGGTVIFSAGNDDSNQEWYPGYYEPVIAVASTTHNDTKAWYSNYGPWVDVAAPGGETDVTAQGVLSTLPGNSYGFYQGTSMACPHVSGLAGLLVSEYGGPGFTNAALREIIEISTDNIDAVNPGYTGMLGSGRINAFTALSSNDSIAPSPINNVSVVSSAEISVTLTWTSTGNDGNSGRASVYDLRYSTSNIDSANFASATQYFGTPSPLVAGSTETCSVTGLTPGTKYYFALKAADVFGNTSLISNVVNATTLDAPIASVNPASLSSVIDSGQTDMQSFYLKNVGQAQLSYSIASQGSAVISSFAVKNNTSKISFSSEPQKGEPDLRKGHPVLSGAGDDGPDGFGYRWIDSDEPGGPAFNWQDISATGTGMYLGDDDYFTVNLPFSVNFYGIDYSTVYVSSNGYLTFSSDDPTDYSNDQIPDSYYPNLFIAPFWTDLYPPSGGAIYYKSDANKLIVQYQNIYNIDGSGDNTFQIILGKDGSIKMQYLLMNGYTSYSTTGIENQDGTDGLQIAFNTDYIHNNLAIQISSAPQIDIIKSIDPISGSVATGDSVEIQVEISSDSLVPGNYQDQVLISSNDPLHPVIGVPVNLHVNGAAVVTTNPGSLAFGQVFLTDTTELSFQIINTGNDSLIVTEIESSNSAFIVEPYSANPIFKNGTINVTVRFGPALDELYEDTLTLISNAVNNPVEIILTGEGANPPVIIVTPDSLAADLLTDETETQVINIDNTGGGSNLVVSISVKGISNITTQQVPFGNINNNFKGQTYSSNRKPLRNHKLVPASGGVKTSATGTKVLILHDDDSDVSEIYGLLNAFTDLSVYTLDGDLNAVVLDTLTKYGSVIVGNNGSWNDPVNLGNVLADYVDNGGSVIVTVPTFYEGFGIEGRFLTEGYFPVNQASNIAYDILDWYNPGHPIMSNITSIEADWILNDATINSDAEDIAEFTSGGIMVGTKGKVAVLNIFVAGSGNWIGDVPALFHNTINFYNKTNWLVPEVISDTIPAGTSQNINVTFDATDMFGGDYDANLVINSNVPTTPVVVVPAQLHVTGIPQIAVSTESLEFGQVFTGYADSLMLYIENTGTDLLIIDTIYSTDVHFVPELESLVIEATETDSLKVYYNAGALEVNTASLFLHSNANNSSLVEILMMGESVLPPVISVTPDSMAADLLTDETETQVINIDNSTGGSNLTYSIDVEYIDILNEAKLQSIIENRNKNISTNASAKAPIQRNSSLIPNTPDLTAADSLLTFDNGNDGVMLGGNMVWIGDGGGHLVCDYWDDDDYIFFTTPVYIKSMQMNGYPGESYIVGDLGLIDINAYDIDNNLIWSSTVDLSGTTDWTDWENVTIETSNISYLEFKAPGNDPHYNEFWPSIDNILIGSPISWLNPESLTGTVPAGTSQNVNITFDATDLAIGNYDAYLVINSNDPATPVINIPAHLQVLEFYNNDPVFSSTDHLYLKINDNTLVVDLDTMFTDADSDELSYSHSLSNSTVANVLNDDNLLAIIPLSVGEVTCEVVANDGRGGTVSQDIVITAEEGSSVPDITVTAMEIYPNPFIDKAYLKFELQEAGYLQLMVYSSDGKLIGSYVNDYVSSGKHRIEFDATGILENVFIYHLVVNDKVVNTGSLVKR
jgi:subtilisin family serine protease